MIKIDTPTLGKLTSKFVEFAKQNLGASTDDEALCILIDILGEYADPKGLSASPPALTTDQDAINRAKAEGFAIGYDYGSNEMKQKFADALLSD